MDCIAFLALGSFWDNSTGWWDDLKAYIKVPESAFAFIQAEKAFRQTISKKEGADITESPGASIKALTMPDFQGYQLNWALSAVRAGKYSLLFKYNAKSSRSMKIEFSETNIISEFPETTKKWGFEGVPVEAKQGNHILTLETLEKGITLDWIALVPGDINPEKYGKTLDQWLEKSSWFEKATRQTAKKCEEQGIAPPTWKDFLKMKQMPSEKELKMYAEKGKDEISASLKKILKQQTPLLETTWRIPPFKGIGEETGLSPEYYKRLLKYLRYSAPLMKDWPHFKGCRYHKRDDHLEHGVRQNAVVAFAYSTILLGTFDEGIAGVPRSQIEEELIRLLRYIAITHNANFLPTGDGDSWGDHWQSAHWANFAVHAAWQVWDRIPEDVKLMTLRMLIHEANRFNERPPDSGVKFDTKAEENAWNSQIIALASCMLPDHPNNSIWKEQSIVWMLNSLVREEDRNETSIVDGKPVKDRVKAVTIHPDFTLENHGRVHPDYMACGYLKLRNAHLYKAGGIPVPESCFYGIGETFDILYHLTATNGSFFYVNGQDWRPHRHDTCLIMWGCTNTLMNDPKGAFLERATLDFLARMHAPFKNGTVADSRTYIYPNPEEEMMARYAEMYILHRMYGDGPEPVSKSDFLESQSYTRVFEIGGFVTHRTPTKFASFAWKNGAMGLVFPSDDTWFTAPSERGLVGRISCKDADDTKPKVLDHFIKAKDGFRFGARIERCGGKIDQWMAMVSLPEDPVIYMERLEARQQVTINERATAMAAIFNEDAPGISPNFRTLYFKGGKEKITGESPEPEKLRQWKSHWLNAEGKFGFITTQPQVWYRDNNKYRRGRLEEEIIGNFQKGQKTYNPGEEIGFTGIVLIPNESPEQTTQQTLRMERKGNNIFICHFKGIAIMANLGKEQERFEFNNKSYKLNFLEIMVIEDK